MGGTVPPFPHTPSQGGYSINQREIEYSLPSPEQPATVSYAVTVKINPQYISL
jgi:hypothetical protein